MTTSISYSSRSCSFVLVSLLLPFVWVRGFVSHCASTRIIAAHIQTSGSRPSADVWLLNAPNINSDDNDDFEQVKDSQFRERNKRWVVLVDDEESIRMAVGDYLYDQGYQVTACSDATALVEVVNLPPSENQLPAIPDVIVSDIRMPGKDGLTLLNYIRSNPRLSRVPVVLLTAKALTQDRIEGYNAGADVYLTKPFDPDELLAIVDNLIVRKHQMTGGQLTDLQQDLANIKQLLKVNALKTVQQTSVYLTPSERQVLELVCEGWRNTEIAQHRGVTSERVAGILQQLYSKTETKNRTDLVRWALKTGYASRKKKPT